MANTPLNATAYTLGSRGRIAHAAGAGGTPPGPCVISYASNADTTITLNHTPPDDADYSTTEFYATAIGSGTDGSTTGSGTSVTISSLSENTNYVITAVSKNTSGVRGIPDFLAQVVRTLPTSSPASSHTIRNMDIEWYIDRSATQHSASPRQIDAALPIASGKLEMHSVHLHAGQVRDLTLRGVCKAPVKHLEIVALGLTLAVPRNAPQGRPME